MTLVLHDAKPVLPPDHFIERQIFHLFVMHIFADLNLNYLEIKTFIIIKNFQYIYP
jgi:hypothetical protein